MVNKTCEKRHRGQDKPFEQLQQIFSALCSSTAQHRCYVAPRHTALISTRVGGGERGTRSSGWPVAGDDTGSAAAGRSSQFTVLTNLLYLLTYLLATPKWQRHRRNRKSSTQNLASIGGPPA